MATPTIVIGDGWSQLVTLKAGTAAYSIDSGATVKAAIIATDHSALESTVVTITEADPGNDWTNGVVMLEFDTTSLAGLSAGLSKIEIEVTESGDKNTWFGVVKVVNGLIP